MIRRGCAKIKGFLICLFCRRYRQIDNILSPLFGLPLDKTCLMGNLKLQVDYLDRYARCTERSGGKAVTKLELLVYGILFEIYIGFRLVLAFPEVYPQFAWLFSTIDAITSTWHEYIRFLTASAPGVYVFIIASVFCRGRRKACSGSTRR